MTDASPKFKPGNYAVFNFGRSEVKRTHLQPFVGRDPQVVARQAPPEAVAFGFVDIEYDDSGVWLPLISNISKFTYIIDGQIVDIEDVRQTKPRPYEDREWLYRELKMEQYQGVKPLRYRDGTFTVFYPDTNILISTV